MQTHLLQEGELLSRLLAHSSRLGVFAENEDLLEDPMEGIKHHKEVILVQVFTKDGKLLSRQGHIKNKTSEKTLKNTENAFKKAAAAIGETGSTFNVEEEEKVDFWAPVFSRNTVSEEEMLFQNNSFRDSNNLIGFVRIVFTKELMKRNMQELLIKSILIPFFFIIPSWSIIYFLIKRVTRPLKKLTEGVVAVGKGSSVRLLNVETKDEIGKLALAFNNMVISLKSKEAEKNHIEEQLRQSQKMEAIGTLVGGIAHDFNNILSVIIGYVNLLQRKNDFKDNSRVYVDNLLSTAERASSLIKSLLAFSRRQTIELRPVRIDDVFRNLENNLLRLIGEEIEYKILIEENDLTVLSDTGQIEQILVNLAINARDAMAQGGTLTISAKSVITNAQLLTFSGYIQPGQYVVIYVTDTGTGLNKQIKEKMFEPFFTTKEVGKGTGLGLSMVYGLIKQHNGFIDVMSEPGKGTTFKIYFQLIKPAIVKETPESFTTLQGGTETILLAEDNVDVRTLTSNILRQSGYCVIEAIDGNDAVRVFNENMENIDFILMDVVMPKKNGLEAYKEIVKLRPGIKALFVSGHADDILHLKIQTSEEEPINFLPKPLSADSLLLKIRELLDK